MDYYSFNAISNALQCAFCSQKFVFAVKMIPECGNSICGICYEKVLEKRIKSNEYECKACSAWHTMPANGLGSNQAIINILKAKPEQRALPEKAEELKSLIASVQQELDEFGKLDLESEVNTHCNQLKVAVLKSLKKQRIRLKTEADNKIQQIEEHRRKQLDSLGKEEMAGQPSKRLKTSDNGQAIAESVSPNPKSTDQEFNEISANIARIACQWGEYFSKLSKVVSDAELEKACNEIRTYTSKIQELKQRTKSGVIGEHNMRWKANKKQLKKINLLGKLHIFLEDEKLTSCSVQVNLKKPSSEKVAEASCRCISTLKGHLDELKDMVFLPDGGRLASCSLDGTIRIWQQQNGDQLFTLNVPGTCAISLAALNCGKKSWQAAGCENGWILIWDLAKRKVVKTLKGHADKVVSLRALPDGNLASMSLKSTIGVWKIPNGNLLYSLPGDQIRVLPADLQTLSNRHLMTKSIENSQQGTAVFRIVNPRTGKLVRSVPTMRSDVVSWLVLSDDRIALGFVDSKIELFDLTNSSRKLLAKFPAGQVSSMTQLPGSRLACSLTTNPPVIRILDLNSNSEVESISPECDKKQTLYLASSGRILASTAAQNSIQLWSFSKSN